MKVYTIYLAYKLYFDYNLKRHQLDFNLFEGILSSFRDNKEHLEIKTHPDREFEKLKKQTSLIY